MPQLLYSTQTISDHQLKEYFAQIQLQYYKEPRQYNHLFEDQIKFPTKTNVIGFKKLPKGKALSFISGRQHTVEISQIPY